MPRPFAAVVVTALICACGALGGQEGDHSPPDPVPEDQAGDQGAQTTCGLLFDCACDGHTGHYGTVDTCEMAWADAFADMQALADEDGLTFDGQCMAWKLDRAEEQACAAQAVGGCEIECGVFHGDLDVGEGCTMYSTGIGDFTNCRRGLWCGGNGCFDPCAVLDEGETCSSPTELRDNCDEGLYCDVAFTKACRAYAQVGESCAEARCADDAYCVEDSCADKLADGEACVVGWADAWSCESGFCREGACGAPPTEGEDCHEGARCGPGLTCERTDTYEGGYSGYCVPDDSVALCDSEPFVPVGD